MDIWDTSCPDWKTRIVNKQSLVPDLPLFREEADRALRNFKRLRAPSLPNKPLMGAIAGDWMFPIIEAVFGSYDPGTNMRMIQEYFLLVPKKNGKTMYASAIMVVAMIMNRRPNAEFLLIAPTKEIALRSFRNIAQMIKADPELDKMFNIRWHNKAIDMIDQTHAGSGSYLQVLAADLETITGTTALFILIDETHVFASKASAKQVFVEIRGALSANPDGCLIQISTQSKAPPSGVFAAELKMAKAVRDGVPLEISLADDGEKDEDDDGQGIPSSLLPIIYELPQELAKDGGWRKRKTWPLVNPNLGLSVREAFLTRELAKADQDGADALALFASQHLNVEMGLAHNADSWAGLPFWDQNAAPLLTLDDLIEQCEVICGGVDGGGLDDLLSLGFVGRVRNRKQWLFWSKSWAHEIVLAKRKSEAQKLRDFESDGDLVIVKDMTDAFRQLADICEHVDQSGKLSSIGFDPVGVGLIVDALALKQIDGERIVNVPQNYTLQGAVKTAEVKLSSGEMTHAGQPIMRWAVQNAKVEAIGNAIKITKAVVGKAKIDPLMAMFDAVALMSRNPAIATSGWQTDNMAALISKIEAAARVQNNPPRPPLEPA